MAVLTPMKVKSQVTANFSLSKDNVCRGELIAINNESSGFERLEYDFCPMDMRSVPTITPDIGAPQINSYGIKIIEHNGEYTGFSVGGPTDDLIRYDFGNSLLNNPDVVNLGDLGILDGPEGIDIIKEGDRWVGLIGHFQNTGGRVVRVIWNDLKNIPLVEDIGNLNVVSRIRNVNILKQGNDFIAVLPYYNGSTLIRVNFGSSLTNPISSATIINSSPLTSVQFPVGGTVVSKNGEYYVILASINTKTISVFSLGNDLMSTPVLIKSQSFPEYFNLAKIKVIQELDKYYALLTSQNGTSRFIDLKNLNSTDVFEVLEIESLPLSYGIEVVKDKGRTIFFGARANLNRIIFNDLCSASKLYSTESNTTIQFTGEGEQNIDLRATDEYGFQDYHYSTVTVTPNSAPSIAIQSQNNCLLNPIDFTAESPDPITTHTWSFGDTNTGTGQSVQHQYAAAGTYTVRLNVDDGTCSNFTTDTLRVYPDAPSPDFSYTTVAACTNNDIMFTNLSDELGIPDSVISYNWDFNGELSLEESNPTIVFQTTGNKNITLTASIPGCTNQTTQSLLINEGALADFSVQSNCEDFGIDFQNLSSGNITGYEWSFGDGQSSSTQNPVHSYNQDGTFDVSLRVTNDLGCVTERIRSLVVHDRPEVDFTTDLSCERTGTTLYDQTALSNANIVNWEWQVEGQIFNGRDISYTFPEEGTYNVQLTVTSQFNCIDSVTSTVNVLPSPVADFTYEAPCLNEPTIFTDASRINQGTITDRFWFINGQLVNETDLVYQFANSGSYEIQLVTIGDNLCRNSVTKTLEIAPISTAIFNLPLLCTGTESVINADITSEDPVTQYSWLINGELLGTDAQLNYSPSVPGDYHIDLTIDTEAGCQYVFRDSIVAYQSPVADFEVSTVFGGAPLVVEVDDRSQNATSVSWRTNGTPVFLNNDNLVLNTTGEYRIDQIASSNEGCADSAFLNIEVVPGILDLAITDAQYEETNNNLRLQVTIANEGTLQVPTSQILVNINNKAIVGEQVQEFLNAGDQVVLELSAIFQDDPEFLCLTIVAPESEMQDVNPGNNQLCISFDDLNRLLSPYPNPASTTIYVPVMLSEDGEVQVDILDNFGKTVYNGSAEVSNGHLEYLELDVATLPEGYYHIKVRNNSISKTFPVVITR